MTDTTHACPPDGSGLMPCCGRTPLEVPRTDRMTEDPTAVTCAARATPDNPVTSGDAADNPAPAAHACGCSDHACDDAPCRYCKTCLASVAPAVAAPATADDGLREQYLAALVAWLDEPDEGRGWADLATEAADAVLAVRDRRMEQLARAASEAKAAVDEVRDALTAAGHSRAEVSDWPDVMPALRDLIDQRDQLAAVADADSKQLAEVDARCDRYAATIARVRDLTGRWAKRTDQLKRAAELLDAALDPKEPTR